MSTLLIVIFAFVGLFAYAILGAIVSGLLVRRGVIADNSCGDLHEEAVLVAVFWPLVAVVAVGFLVLALPVAFARSVYETIAGRS